MGSMGALRLNAWLSLLCSSSEQAVPGLASPTFAARGQPLQLSVWGVEGKFTLRSLVDANAVAIAIAVLSTGHIASVNRSITIF